MAVSSDDELECSMIFFRNSTDGPTESHESSDEIDTNNMLTKVLTCYLFFQIIYTQLIAQTPPKNTKQTAGMILLRKYNN
jgi:hypothetical protein